MKEIFKKIQNYHYSISNLGNVRNDKTMQLLKPQISPFGYHTVLLYKERKAQNVSNS